MPKKLSDKEISPDAEFQKKNRSKMFRHNLCHIRAGQSFKSDIELMQTIKEHNHSVEMLINEKIQRPHK